MEIILWLILGVIVFGIFTSKGSKKIVDQALGNNHHELLAKKGLGKRRGNQRYLVVEKPSITLSEEAEKALILFEETKNNIFLTGRAGTGKSTLLRFFRATTKKKIVVLAYTGVAAVNIQGQTIHSFFGFKPGITEDKVRHLNHDPNNIYRKLDAIVIDEISMVRADLLDCVEKFLRLNGPAPNKPFGGVQMILIGDPYQLPPIVKENERMIFEKHYQSQFFFDSKGYINSRFEKIELTHIYRQSDKDFIEILDSIRLCRATDAHIAKINERLLDNKNVQSENDFSISLVTTNSMANSINIAKLTELSGDSKIYQGIITGNVKEGQLPAEQELTLKEGAQIMLLNNDSKGRWINGNLAKIVKLDESSVRVLFEDNTFDDIAPYKWETIQFSYDEQENKIQSEIMGSFTQLPIRLAWAVTIHKGQGKTFERATIDFGTGTFVSGQAYVALSRCKSLDGLMLKNPLEHRHIFIDTRIDEFMNKGS